MYVSGCPKQDSGATSYGIHPVCYKAASGPRGSRCGWGESAGRDKERLRSSREERFFLRRMVLPEMKGSLGEGRFFIRGKGILEWKSLELSDSGSSWVHMSWVGFSEAGFFLRGSPGKGRKFK